MRYLLRSRKRFYCSKCRKSYESAESLNCVEEELEPGRRGYIYCPDCSFKILKRASANVENVKIMLGIREGKKRKTKYEMIKNAK